MSFIEENTKSIRTSESEFLVPTLRIIQKNKRCSMSQIKKEIYNFVTLYPADLELSKSRTNEEKYKQIVGNQKSHSSFTKYVKSYDIGEIGNSEILYELNDKGESFLNKLAFDDLIDNAQDYELNHNIQTTKEYDGMDLDDINNRIPEPGEGNSNHRYKTDARLAKTVLKKNNYECEYAKCIGIKHETFITKIGHPYLEAHHLIPMKAQKDKEFAGKNLDREENIVALCPNCHRAIHFGSYEEKRKILKKLYDERIERLRNCPHHIDISFEDLMMKYYK